MCLDTIYPDTFIGNDDKEYMLYNNFINKQVSCIPFGKFYIFNKINYIEIVQRTFLPPQIHDQVLPIGKYNVDMYKVDQNDDGINAGYYIRWISKL